MADTPRPTRRSLRRPLALSLLGAALVAPVPVFAGAPSLIPGWLLAPVGGVPLLSWILVLLMVALVGVALSASTIGTSDD